MATLTPGAEKYIEMSLRTRETGVGNGRAGVTTIKKGVGGESILIAALGVDWAIRNEWKSHPPPFFFPNIPQPPGGSVAYVISRTPHGAQTQTQEGRHTPLNPRAITTMKMCGRFRMLHSTANRASANTP